MDAIRLHAPADGWALICPRALSPAGVHRVALDLGEDDPCESRRKLAGCELLVYDGDERIGRLHAHGRCRAQAAQPARSNRRQASVSSWSPASTARCSTASS